MDELAVLVHPDAADVHGVGFGRIRLRRSIFRLRFRLDQILRQHLAQHQVGVGPAEPESGYAGDRMAAVTRPLTDLFGDLEMHPVEVDVGVGPRVVDRRRNLVVVQRQCDLGQACRTGRRLQVPQVGLDRAEQCGLVGGAAAAHHAAQGVGLDGVAEDGAGAVRLDVVDGARVDAGVVIGLAQHLGLGVGVGGQHAVGAAVVVDRTAGDDGEDLVAVAACVRQSLEHDHAAALGTGVAVGVGGERLDPAVRRQDAADLVETDRNGRCDKGIHATGQHHVGLAGTQ